MAIRDIVFFPNQVLTTPTKKVESFDDELKTLVADMAETMYDAPGIGLAAPQVGVLQRVAVIDITRGEEERDLLVLVNPEIVHREGKILWEEGCLSIPQVYEKIERSKQVTVRAQDENGETFEIEADELLAVALQHEIDHLDGVLFFDRMSQLKRTRALKKYKKVMENRALEAEEAQAEGDAS